MNCPKCNHPLEAMWYEQLNDTTVETVGHCNNCDFDAIWKIQITVSGESREYDLRQYFFG